MPSFKTREHVLNYDCVALRQERKIFGNKEACRLGVGSPRNRNSFRACPGITTGARVNGMNFDFAFSIEPKPDYCASCPHPSQVYLCKPACPPGPVLV